MGFSDWYFGRKSQNSINREIVLNLENEVRYLLKTADDSVRDGEQKSATNSIISAKKTLRHFYVDGIPINGELHGYFSRVVIDYLEKFFD